jgi:mono/diheme cytochrome c family protein
MFARHAALPAILLAVLGCSRAPADLREWTPSDHDHTQDPTGAQVPANQPSSAGMFGISEVVLAAWRQNCTTCHGAIGRGDGPQAAMTKPRDLTDPGWQATLSDADIASVIKTGRGAMPAFELPESTVDGLVRLVRLLDPTRARTSDGGPEQAPADAGGAAADAPVPEPKTARDGGARRGDAGR